MYKYLTILMGICLIASSALGSDSVKKINEPHDLGELTVEEIWYPMQIFEIREDFSHDRSEYSKSKSMVNLLEGDSISFPLKLKIKGLQIPKVRLTFKVTF